MTPPLNHVTIWILENVILEFFLSNFSVGMWSGGAVWRLLGRMFSNIWGGRRELKVEIHLVFVLLLLSWLELYYWTDCPCYHRNLPSSLSFWFRVKLVAAVSGFVWEYLQPELNNNKKWGEQNRAIRQTSRL